MEIPDVLIKPTEVSFPRYFQGFRTTTKDGQDAFMLHIEGEKLNQTSRRYYFVFPMEEFKDFIAMVNDAVKEFEGRGGL